jgi:hypothetical protein
VKLSTGKIIAIVAVLTAVAIGIVFAVNIAGINQAGYGKESKLNAQFLSNQNALSDCVTKIRETANIAGAEADKFEAVMVEAIKGRYDGRTANPGQMFSAITEQYPDLKPLSAAFERVHTTVVGCRSDYRGKQDKLLDMLSTYDSWRLSWFVNTFGTDFPSQNLIARIGGDTSRKGQAALDQMYTIVVTKDTVDAYNSGTMTAEQPFPQNTSTPATSTTR